MKTQRRTSLRQAQQFSMPPARWLFKRGFIAVTKDDLEVTHLPLEDAKRRCEDLPGCAAITFQKEPDSGPGRALHLSVAVQSARAFVPTRLASARPLCLQWSFFRRDLSFGGFPQKKCGNATALFQMPHIKMLDGIMCI